MTVRAHADYAALIDGVYALSADERAWAQALAMLLGSLFEGVVATGALLWQHDTRYRAVHTLFTEGCGRVVDDSAVDAIGHHEFVRFVERAGLVSTHSELAPHLSAQARAQLHGRLHHDEPESIDGIELHTTPIPGLALWLIVKTRARVQLTARQRMRLVQLGLHVQNALRLRRRPDEVRALVLPDGTIRGQLRSLWRAHVEVAGAPQVQALWRALVSGSHSLVPHVETGMACYGVLENEPEARAHRALSPDEARIVQHASRGLSNKLLGYALGLSPSTISRTLESAALKLGLGSRAKLVRLASLLSGTEIAADEPILTPAESEVLSLVRDGLSNRDIGLSRGRSERTIANQVASLLRKTGSANRRRLIAGCFHSTK